MCPVPATVESAWVSPCGFSACERWRSLARAHFVGVAGGTETTNGSLPQRARCSGRCPSRTLETAQGNPRSSFRTRARRACGSERRSPAERAKTAGKSKTVRCLQPDHLKVLSTGGRGCFVFLHLPQHNVSLLSLHERCVSCERPSRATRASLRTVPFAYLETAHSFVREPGRPGTVNRETVNGGLPQSSQRTQRGPSDGLVWR